MQFSQQPVGVFRRAVTAAATFGLTAVLAVTATPARSEIARPGAASSSAQCANADGPVAIAGHGTYCPPSAALPMLAAPDKLDSAPDEKKRVAKQDNDQDLDKRGRSGRRVCGPPFVQGNPLLGPVFLPRRGYLGTLLFDYIRYGGLTPAQFLAKYRGPTDWIFPPDDGFARNSSGMLLRFRVTLFRGQFIDRFGNEFGRFLGAGGTPFIARSLPPDSLNTPANDPTHICNYHLYRVLKAFDVDGGPTAPWFEQPGGGLQYAINPAFLPAGATAPFIPWLVDHGFLQRVF